MDLWSLGTIIFELLTLDMFATGNDDVEHVAAAMCRLSDFSEQQTRVLGCEQHAKPWSETGVERRPVKSVQPWRHRRALGTLLLPPS